MKAIALRILALILFSALSGCGGGGGGINVSTISGSTVYISGNVNKGLWPAAGGGTQLQYMATVIVANSTYNGTPISNASVVINGAPLAFNSSLNRFEGIVLPDAAGQFVLTVAANGETHTATAVAMTSVPVITVQNPFIAAQPNTISWSAAGGGGTGVAPLSYMVDVVETNTTRLVHTASTTGLTTTVPANATTAATAYYTTVYAINFATLISSAASGSNFAVSASASVVNFTPQ